MAKRDQAHKIARETGADWQYYRDCLNDVKRVLLEAEKEYVQNEVKKNQSSSERWKVIRNCLPTREKSRPAYSRDMKELATEFNEFFTEVGVVPQKKPKDSHQSMIYLLYIRNSVPVLYPKKMSFNFELLPLLRSIGLISHFLQIKHQGKINYIWQR